MNSLAELHDIVLPEPVGWWPLAWGWWVLMLLLIGAMIGLGWWLQQRQLRHQTRKLAVAELNRYQQQLSAHAPASYAAMNAIVKRAVLQLWPAQEVASLQGIDWLRFLVAQVPATKHQEIAEPLLAYQHKLYQPTSASDAARYHGLLLQWLEQCLPLRKALANRRQAEERNHV